MEFGDPQSCPIWGQGVRSHMSTLYLASNSCLCGLPWVRSFFFESKSHWAITCQPTRCWENECLSRVRASGMLTTARTILLRQALAWCSSHCMGYCTLSLCTQKPVVPWEPNSRYHHVLEVSPYSPARSTASRHSGENKDLSVTNT